MTTIDSRSPCPIRPKRSFADDGEKLFKQRVLPLHTVRQNYTACLCSTGMLHCCFLGGLAKKKGV